MRTAVCHVDMASVTLLPLCLQTWIWPKPLTKRSHTRNFLSPNALASSGSILTPPGRVRAYVHLHLHNTHKAYVHLHLHNTHKCSIYKPAPYLTHPSCPYQLELLRIRSQDTIHIIPSHLHYAFRAPRADYQDRVCPHSLAKGIIVLGDEPHITSHCPATKGVLQQFTAIFQELTRILDLPPSRPSHPTR